MHGELPIPWRATKECSNPTSTTTKSIVGTSKNAFLEMDNTPVVSFLLLKISFFREQVMKPPLITTGFRRLAVCLDCFATVIVSPSVADGEPPTATLGTAKT